MSFHSLSHQAQQSYEMGELDEAVVYCEQASKYPVCYQASLEEIHSLYFLWGSCLIILHQPEQATYKLQMALEKVPSDIHRVLTLQLLARACLADGRLELALYYTETSSQLVGALYTQASNQADSITQGVATRATRLIKAQIDYQLYNLQLLSQELKTSDHEYHELDNLLYYISALLRRNSEQDIKQARSLVKRAEPLARTHGHIRERKLLEEINSILEAAESPDIRIQPQSNS